MKAIDMIRKDVEFKDIGELFIAAQYCPFNWIEAPDYCKGRETLIDDCIKCWNREVKGEITE